MQNCNHQFHVEDSRLHCRCCNQYWRGTQALETLVNQLNTVQNKLDNIEEIAINQYTLALGKLGLEPCNSCGEFMLDRRVKKGWEQYNPQRKVACDFGEEGIHIRLAGDCVLCSSCLLEKLQQNYFEDAELGVIAGWVVHNFGDVRIDHVVNSLASIYRSIAQAIAPYITDEIICKQRG